jgi:hypothetical protein
MQFKLTGIGAGQTADLHLVVWDAAGVSAVGGDDQPLGWSTGTLPYTPFGMDALGDTGATGTVLVEVEGVGGYALPENGGYTDYGSVGRYHLTMSGCAGVNGIPPAQVSTFTATQTPKTGTLTLSWAAPDQGGSAITGYRIYGLPSGTVDVPATDRSDVFTGLDPGSDYELGIAAVNSAGAGPVNRFTKHLDRWTPTAAPKLTTSAWGTTMILNWTEPANPGRALGTTWTVRVYAGGSLIDSFTTEYGRPGVKFTGVGNGHYKLEAFLSYNADSGTRSGVATTTADVGPSATRIGTPSSGTAGGTATATARWLAPYTLRGQTITSYTVGAYKLDSSNRIVKVYVSSPRSASARSYVWALPKGRYKFRVQAHASGGWTPVSTFSTIATSR